MRYGDLEFSVMHIGKVSKYKLVREIKQSDTNEKEVIKKALKYKKLIESAKKSFFGLFDELTRKQLKRCDDATNKEYLEFCKQTPLVMKNRTDIEVGMRFDGSIEFEIDVDEQHLAIYKIRREKDKFIPTSSEKYEHEKYTKEEELIEKYREYLDRLAKALYAQEEYIKCVLNTSIQDEQAINIAIELAIYLGYISSEEKENISHLHR